MKAQVLVKTKDLPQDEWLKERSKGLGGSDAAAACGFSPWKSPMRLWLEKTGQVEPEEAGEPALWGIKMEAVVADHFAEVNGFKVQRCNAILQHPQFPWMLANIDRYVMDPKRGRGVLEVKTTSAFNKDAGDDSIPEYYLVQVYHYLAVTGLQFAWVAILKGGQHYCQHLVERNEQAIQNLIAIESLFWNENVLKRIPPAFDGSSDANDLLNQLYPEGRPNTIDLPPTAEEWIRKYEQAQAEEKAAATRKDQAAQMLKDMLKDNEIGRIGERRVTWKTVASRRLDTNAIKADGLYDKYAVESVSRRFSIS